MSTADVAKPLQAPQKGLSLPQASCGDSSLGTSGLRKLRQGQEQVRHHVHSPHCQDQGTAQYLQMCWLGPVSRSWWVQRCQTRWRAVAPRGCVVGGGRLSGSWSCSCLCDASTLQKSTEQKRMPMWRPHPALLASLGMPVTPIRQKRLPNA